MLLLLNVLLSRPSHLLAVIQVTVTILLFQKKSANERNAYTQTNRRTGRLLFYYLGNHVIMYARYMLHFKNTFDVLCLDALISPFLETRQIDVDSDEPVLSDATEPKPVFQIPSPSCFVSRRIAHRKQCPSAAAATINVSLRQPRCIMSRR